MFEQAEQDGKTKQKRENDHTVFKQSELEGKKEEREQLKKKKSYRSVSFGFFPSFTFDFSRLFVSCQFLIQKSYHKQKEKTFAIMSSSKKAVIYAKS